MRTAAMVLGITGGVLGILAGLVVLLIGGVAGAFKAENAGTVVGLGYAVFFVAVLAIVGGAVAKAKPVAAGIVLLLTGIGGFICVSSFWLLSSPLLLIGALLAFIGAKQRPDVTPVAIHTAYGQPYPLPQIQQQFIGYDAHGRPLYGQPALPQYQPSPQYFVPPQAQANYDPYGGRDIYVEGTAHENPPPQQPYPQRPPQQLPHGQR